MTTAQAKRKMQAADRALDRARGFMLAVLDGAGDFDEEAGHYLNDALSHTDEATMNTSKYVTHLTPEEWR